MENIIKEVEEKESILKVKGVTYWYDKEQIILDNIDIEFEKGKYYAVVGSSGSGKTTLLALISGLDSPREGDIVYKGDTLKNIGLEKYRNNHVSIIFQGYNLLNYMTAIQNIISAMSIKGIKKENSKSYVIDMLKRVGLTEEQGNQKVLTLSGGQQQRVAIARALCCENDLIIADEPTGNLDEKTSKEVIALFKDIVYKEGKTVIIVTHDKDISKGADVTFKVSNKKVTRA